MLIVDDNVEFDYYLIANTDDDLVMQKWVSDAIKDGKTISNVGRIAIYISDILPRINS